MHALHEKITNLTKGTGTFLLLLVHQREGEHYFVQNYSSIAASLRTWTKFDG